MASDWWVRSRVLNSIDSTCTVCLYTWGEQRLAHMTNHAWAEKDAGYAFVRYQRQVSRSFIYSGGGRCHVNA